MKEEGRKVVEPSPSADMRKWKTVLRSQFLWKLLKDVNFFFQEVSLKRYLIIQFLGHFLRKDIFSFSCLFFGKDVPLLLGFSKNRIKVFIFRNNLRKLFNDKILQILLLHSEKIIFLTIPSIWRSSVESRHRMLSEGESSLITSLISHFPILWNHSSLHHILQCFFFFAAHPPQLWLAFILRVILSLSLVLLICHFLHLSRSLVFITKLVFRTAFAPFETKVCFLHSRDSRSNKMNCNILWNLQEEMKQV